MQTYTFICGCGHTGTSLLANMFASHEDVFIPHHETNTFLRPRRVDDRWAILAEEAEASGKAHFVEKTPRHIQHIDAIRSKLPTAKVIAMMRDPRDVAASYLKRMGSAQFGVERWMENNKFLIAEDGASDIIVQKLEDVIEDPESALRRVCDFSGVPYSDDMLNYHTEERLWFGRTEVRKGTGTDGREHVHLRNWQINQPIFDTRGKWRDVLTSEDLDLFESEELAGMMTHFGYS